MFIRCSTVQLFNCSTFWGGPPRLTELNICYLQHCVYRTFAKSESGSSACSLSSLSLSLSLSPSLLHSKAIFTNCTLHPADQSMNARVYFPNTSRLPQQINFGVQFINFCYSRCKSLFWAPKLTLFALRAAQ